MLTTDYDYDTVTAYKKWVAGDNAVFWRSHLTNGLSENFPGGSRARVTRAGDHVRDDIATPEDLLIIDTWRDAHRNVLNSFQSILRNRTRNTAIIVAQRHKRKRTIFDKLKRFDKMNLGRMDDVAGCRLIFNSISDIGEFRTKMHSARFKHKLKNERDKYDYISHPKPDGYRGIHDIYEYDVNSKAGQHLKGLLIELQYRTVYQHAWATCVEMVGYITENQPKFGRGDQKIKDVLCLASEVISRAFEDMTSSLPQVASKDVVDKFLELDNELKFMPMLRRLNAADGTISNSKNAILIFGQDEASALEIRTYPTATVAFKALLDLERENPRKDIVLVKGDSPEQVREVFKNYFSDARQFVDLIDKGCELLLKSSVLHMKDIKSLASHHTVGKA